MKVPYNSKLGSAISTIKCFVPYDEPNREMHLSQIDALADLLINLNRDNPRAIIPVSSHLDEEGLDISEYNWIDDYEIITGVKRDEDDNEFYTKEEWEEHIREKAENKFRILKGYQVWCIPDGEESSFHATLDDADKEVERLLANAKLFSGDADDLIINEMYWVTREEDETEESEPYGLHTDLYDAESEREELIDEWIEEKEDAWDDMEFEYDEIYVNWVRNYRGEVNIELAQRLGFGVLEFSYNHHREGEKYMFLQGCGMDLYPKFIAYQALEFGVIDPNGLSYFEPLQFDYFKYVVGSKIAQEVLKELGIANLYQEEVK